MPTDNKRQVTFAVGAVGTSAGCSCPAPGRSRAAKSAARGAGAVARAAIAPSGAADASSFVNNEGTARSEVCSGTGVSVQGGFVWRRVSLSQSSFLVLGEGERGGGGP